MSYAWQIRLNVDNTQPHKQTYRFRQRIIELN